MGPGLGVRPRLTSLLSPSKVCEAMLITSEGTRVRVLHGPTMRKAGSDFFENVAALFERSHALALREVEIDEVLSL